MTFEETLQAANSRIKNDVENAYNLTMKIRMSRFTHEQIELLRELEALLDKVHKYTIETVKTYQE